MNYNSKYLVVRVGLTKCNIGEMKMPRYEQPCKYCKKLVSEDNSVCPHCGKINPIRLQLCPLTKQPLQNGQPCCGYCDWIYSAEYFDSAQ